MSDFERREDGYYGNIEIDDEKKDLEKLLLEGKIFLSPEMIVIGAKCDGSGEDYFKTEKSGIFGEVSYIPDCKMLGFMWTTNPRPICLA